MWLLYIGVDRMASLNRWSWSEMQVRKRMQGKNVLDVGNGRCKGLEADTSLLCWRNTKRFHWGCSEWQGRGGHARRLWRQDPSPASFLPPPPSLPPQYTASYCVPGSIQLKSIRGWVVSLWLLHVEGLSAFSGLPRRNPAPHIPAQAPSTEISERFLWVSALGCEA